MRKIKLYEDIICKDSDSEQGSLLVDPCENLESTLDKPCITGYVGVTINYPPTVRFENANSSQQRMIYAKIWNIARNAFGMAPLDSSYQYEYCKSGRVHLHGYVSIVGKHFPMGAVCDMAKSILRQFPIRHAHFNSHNVYPEYQNYKCASIKIQYYSADHTIDGVEGISHWKSYITKNA